VSKSIALLCLAAVAAPAARPGPAFAAAPAGNADAGVRVARLSPQAEKAIERGLAYLARRQNTDGSWGQNYRPATTSLGLMAFMLKGHFPKKGKYGERLDRAVRYLVAQTKLRGGYVGVNMYEHGLTTLALAEVWGMSDREEIGTALKRAVRIILRSQSTRGGWRYLPRPDQDISVTVMQIVALASAKEAGIHVPANVIQRARTYVKNLQVKYVGGFGYQNAGNPGFARSAAGVMSLLMTGDRDSKEVLLGLEYLRRLPRSKFTKTEFYYYGHYYAIQAMYQAGESYYQQWYPLIQQALLAKQRTDGSWTGGRGGAEYSTAMAVLILGVPYRFLPIYQR
jgi:hypothetical protein